MQHLEYEEYMNQAKILLGQGKYEAAVHFLNKAETIENMNTEVYILKGICLANEEKIEEAQKEFLKVLKINKKEGVAYFHLGNLEVLKGNRGKGIEYYNNAIANGFDDAQVYFSLGLMNEEDNNPDIAIRNYSKAINKDPKRADIRIRKARLFIQIGQLHEAVQCLDELILSNPDVFEGYHLKYLVLAELKKYDAAQAVLDAAISLFPKDPAFAIDKASLEIVKKNYEKALRMFQQIEEKYELENENKHSIARERARVYAYLEDMDHTIKSLNKAKEIASKLEPPRMDLEADYLLMNCYLNTEEYEKVVECARELKKAEGEEYYQLAAYYYEPSALKAMGKETEARKLYEESVSYYRKISLKTPNNVDSYAFRIMSLRQLNQSEKALELADFLVCSNDELPEAHTLRAIVLNDLGRTEEAKKEEAKAAELGASAKSPIERQRG